MRIGTSDFLRAAGLAVLVIAVSWLTGFGLVRIADRLPAAWPAGQLGTLIGCVLGVYLALRLRVRFVAYLLAGQVAFGVAELCLQAIYGPRSVHGRAPHLAVMLAGTLGVLLGWYLSRRTAPSAPVGSSASSPATLLPEARSPHALADRPA